MTNQMSKKNKEEFKLKLPETLDEIGAALSQVIEMRTKVKVKPSLNLISDFALCFGATVRTKLRKKIGEEIKTDHIDIRPAVEIFTQLLDDLEHYSDDEIENLLKAALMFYGILK